MVNKCWDEELERLVVQVMGISILRKFCQRGRNCVGVYMAIKDIPVLAMIFLDFVSTEAHQITRSLASLLSPLPVCNIKDDLRLVFSLKR